MEHLKTSIVVLIAGMVAGCASYPAPTQKMVDAEAAIRSAKEVGAEKVPKAQLHATLAQEQVDKAKKLMNDGDNQRAEMLLLRAQSDAELSLTLAKQEAAKADAQKTSEELKKAKDNLKQQ